MTRRNILWALLTGVPALFGATVATMRASGGDPAPAKSCCSPDCCPPGCCEESAGAKEQKPADDCCPPDCCPPGCCSTAQK